VRWRSVSIRPLAGNTDQVTPFGVGNVPTLGEAMNRNTNMSLLILGIVLGVVGAILNFAVTAEADGFDIQSAGVILMWVGIVTALIGIIFLTLGERRRESTLVESVQHTPTGDVRTETRSDTPG
jgi:hypothetical protein